MSELWEAFRNLFWPRRPRVVKFTGQEGVDEMNERLREWRKSIPAAPTERPAGNVVTLPLGGEYVENVIKPKLSEEEADELKKRFEELYGSALRQ